MLSDRWSLRFSFQTSPGIIPHLPRCLPETYLAGPSWLHARLSDKLYKRGLVFSQNESRKHYQSLKNANRNSDHSPKKC